MFRVVEMGPFAKTWPYGATGPLWMETVFIRELFIDILRPSILIRIRLQLRILLRAMKLLKPQGRIVYSTCSLNPVENEAVVAAALKEQPGKYCF